MPGSRRERADPFGFCLPHSARVQKLLGLGCSDCRAAILNSSTCLKRLLRMQDRVIDKETEVTYCLAG